MARGVVCRARVGASCGSVARGAGCGVVCSVGVWRNVVRCGVELRHRGNSGASIRLVGTGVLDGPFEKH